MVDNGSLYTNTCIYFIETFAGGTKSLIQWSLIIVNYVMENEIYGVLGHNSALQGYIGPGTTQLYNGLVINSKVMLRCVLYETTYSRLLG